MIRTHSQRWQRICLHCWQAANPTEYAPEATDWTACTACDSYDGTVSVHPEMAREARAVRLAAHPNEAREGEETA